MDDLLFGSGFDDSIRMADKLAQPANILFQKMKHTKYNETKNRLKNSRSEK